MEREETEKEEGDRKKDITVQKKRMYTGKGVRHRKGGRIQEKRKETRKKEDYQKRGRLLEKRQDICRKRGRRPEKSKNIGYWLLEKR